MAIEKVNSVSTWVEVNSVLAANIQNINGAAEFVPSGSPLAWYDASKISGKSDGDFVGNAWTDQTANGYDLTAAGEGTQPTYQTNEKNGKPIVRFDGSDFLKAAWSGTEAQVNTAFVVAKITSVVNGRYLFDGHTTHRNAGLVNNSNFAMHATVSILESSVAADTSWHVFSYQFNNTSSIIRVDGTQTQGAGGTSGSDGITVGAASNNGSNITADIAEIIFYNSSESFTANEAGLSAKWGIS
jgi:hypothetical protein